MGYQSGKIVTFDRPGSVGSRTCWTGVIEKVQPDGSLLIRDSNRKLRVVQPDDRWLTEVADEAQQNPASRNRN